MLIEYRYTEGKPERYSEFLAELVSLKVDVIIADGSGVAAVAKKTTSTIPIVMTFSTDPVGQGLISSLARPGGNVTGLTSVTGRTRRKSSGVTKGDYSKAHPLGHRPSGGYFSE